MSKKIKKEIVEDNGWKSRKLWFAIVSFVVLVAAAFTSYLTMNLLIGLVMIPAIYGFANVTIKRIGAAEFSKIEQEEKDA